MPNGVCGGRGRRFFEKCRWLFLSSAVFFLLKPIAAPGQVQVPPAGKSGIAEKSLVQPPAGLQLPPKEKPPEIVIEDSRELADAGAGPSFFVRKIELVGNTLFDSATLAPIVDVGEGMEATLGILTLIANEVAAFYAERGYFLASVHIPQQEVTDGVVKMTISEGRLGKIEVAGNQKIKGEDIAARMQRVRNEGVLSEQTLERTLLELNDLMGVTVRSVLRPGDLPGTSDLVLDVKEKLPYSFGFDGDNFGSRFTGRNRFGVSATAGNLLRFGDQLFIRAVRSDLGQNLLQPSYLLPLDNYGDTFKFTYTYSEQTLGESLAALNAGGQSNNYNLELAHPLYRSRAAQMKLRAGFDNRESRNFTLGQLSSDDKLRSFYVGVGGNAGDPWLGQTFADFKVAKGISRASEEGGLPSRAGGSGDVVVSQLNLTRFQGTNFLNTYFVIKTMGQVVNERVLTGDLFSAGGSGSVRGFPLAEASGDVGFYVNLDYVIPFQWPVPVGFGNLTLDKILSVNSFIDHGEAFVWKEQAGESRQGVTGVGFGAALNIPKVKDWVPAMNFAFTYASAYRGRNPSDGNTDTLYFNGAITYAF